jgi:hypothetical protein
MNVETRAGGIDGVAPFPIGNTGIGHRMTHNALRITGSSIKLVKRPPVMRDATTVAHTIGNGYPAGPNGKRGAALKEG